MGTLIGKKGLMQLALAAMLLGAVSFYLGHDNGPGPDEPPASELSSSFPEASDVKQGVDPAPLRTVAAEDEDQEVRVADANLTTAQQLAADIARKERYPFDQYDAIVKLADPDALRMVIDENRNRGNNLDELAVLKLSLLDPNIRAILPDVELVVDANEITQEYDLPPDSFLRTVYHKGEILTLGLSSGEDEILSKTYRTEFPEKTSVRIHAFHSASIDIVGLLSLLLGRAEFNDSVCVRLAVGGEPAELRQAAVTRLTDQQVLLKIVVEDDSWPVRTAAVERLSDQQVLKQLAFDNPHVGVRAAAARSLTDQQVLASVALEDEDPYVRRAAVDKLTDQQVLASVALEDRDQQVRRGAVAKITDLAILAKVAAQDDSHHIRSQADFRIQSLRKP